MILGVAISGYASGTSNLSPWSCINVSSRIQQMEDQVNDKNDFLVLSVDEIRTSARYRAWAVGPFFPKGDIRCSKEFEIKDWDASTIQPAWRNHARNGVEYIAVLSGVLKAHLGRPSSDGASFEVSETIEMRPHQRLVLAPGVWRRFEGSADVQGITVRQPAR